MIAINWHNSFLHFHADVQTEYADDDHDHHQGHHQHHHHSHSHHHDAGSFWDFLKNILGDFDHPDLGETHFEEFLKPGNQLQLDSEEDLFKQPLVVLIINDEKFENTEFQRVVNSFVFPDFSDPPFLESLSTRGPPAS
ncbi:MAG: hypothetical protein DWQ02_03515 [Bacteroidetes bacterium]|nr:MAG: hypothetical protein DWQ02_03515 [Bacteroidota bacterium]